MTQDQAEALLGFAVGPDWAYTEIKRSGELAGFVMHKGDEVHVFRLPEYTGRWFTRQDVERVLMPIVAKYGAVTTKVRASNEVGRRFVQRLGFIETGSDQEIVFYRAERFNHARL